MKVGVGTRLEHFKGSLSSRLQDLRILLSLCNKLKEKDEKWYVELNPIVLPELLDKGEVNYKLSQDIKKLFEKNGIAMTMHTPFNIETCEWQGKKPNLKTLVELGKALNTEAITLHFCNESNKDKALLMKSLAQVANYATESKMRLNAENMEPKTNPNYLFMNPTELKDVMANLSSDYFGVVYDIGHSNLSSSHFGFDQIALFKSLVNHVNEIHFHDNYGKVCLDKANYGDLHNIPFRGIGNVPAEEFLKALKKDTLIIYEIRHKFEEEFEKSVKRLREITNGK